MEEQGIPAGRRLPKNFLTPWILLVLKQWSLHGYVIMQQLNRMGFPEVDHPTLYRELRRLESQGHVASEWQTDGSGPAKRVYSITEAGEELLLGWTEVVSGYQRMINGFFDLYSQVFGLTPPPARARILLGRASARMKNRPVEPEAGPRLETRLPEDRTMADTASDTVTDTAQAMVKSYNDLMAKSFATAGAGWEQATAMAKSVAEASQAEGKEAGKAWEEMMGCTRTRTGKLTELAREMAAVPASSVAGVKPEVRELLEEVIKGDAGFGKSWAEYVIGMEQRQVELMTGMAQANTVLLESAHEMVKSAFDCGEAFVAWSMATAKPASGPTAAF